VPVTIIEDGMVINFQSSRPTLAMALRDAGIRLGPADEVYPSPSAEVTAGMEVEVRHAKAISLRTGSSTRVIYTHTETLRDALAEAGFALGADDRVEPSVEVAVRNGMTARLVRVAGRMVRERDDVARKTVFKPDENLSGSASRVVQGHDGVRIREYRIVIEDGVETEKTLIDERMEPEVVDNVIYYAAESVRASGLAAESFNVLDTKRLYATWYNAASSGKAATDPSYGITRTGVPVTRGVAAVDPNVIPLGTRLYIPGYGFAVAADTGGGIKGEMIDLGFPDGVPSDWHTGWVEAYVLAP
jgi:3D (Asp-Asp-Asp) domain-containing protein